MEALAFLIFLELPLALHVKVPFSSWMSMSFSSTPGTSAFKN
jgi:hypothetical protein